uniref:Allantoicase domain-containing protein n=1 Tax=Globisporangium ultimum (strain ATCC 200006 / CBS 805.95 / DAOM BR144) TaxID=431595 RepID=K3XBK1_GLOUD
MSATRLDPQDPSLERLTDLASSSFGGRAIFATDEWFAAAHLLLTPDAPVFITDKFTDYGKWMDGWETRRKRIAGQDWCIIELGLRGTIDAIDVDTAFFTGNHSPRVSVQAARFSSDHSTWPQALQKLTAKALPAGQERAMGVAASAEDLALAEQLKSHEWVDILPFVELRPGYEATRHNVFKIVQQGPWTHLRLNMFPDGGIARLRVYGTVLKDWTQVPPMQLVDLVSAEHGGKIIGFNDAHYGHPKNLIAPGRSKTMAGGWETARKSTRPAVLTANAATGLLEVPGKDWCVLKLGHAGVIHEVEVDTNHFKGNFPESCVLFGTTFHGKADQDVLGDNIVWKPILPRLKLRAHEQQYFSVQKGIVNLVPEGVNFVKLEMFPDGGISRLRLRGYKKDAQSSL